MIVSSEANDAVLPPKSLSRGFGKSGGDLFAKGESTAASLARCIEPGKVSRTALIEYVKEPLLFSLQHQSQRCSGYRELSHS